MGAPYIHSPKKQKPNIFITIPNEQRWLMRVCILTYILIIVILSLTISGFDGGRVLLLISSIALVLVSSLPILYRIPNNGDGYLHPLVFTSAFGMLGIVVGQTDILATGLEYHTGLGSWSASDLQMLAIYVNFIGITALVSKYIGYYSAGSSWIKSIQFGQRPNSRFMPLLILWMLLGGSAMLIIIQGSGGFQAHLTNMNRGHSASVYVAHEKLLGGAAFIVQSTIVIPALYAMFKKNGHRSVIFILLFIVSALLAYLINGRRSAVLTPVLFAIAIWIYKERGFPLVRTVVFGVLLFLFLSIGAMWRESNRSFSAGINWSFLEGVTVEQLAERSMEELSDRSGSSAPIYAIAARVPSEVPFTYGLNYFENLYRFIPRAIWPEKPRGVGIQTAEVFYNRIDKGGIPPGALGEAYWSLHLPGVIIVFFTYGMLLRLLAGTLIRYPKSAAFFLLYILTLLRFAPDQVSFRVWIFIVVPTIVFMYLTGLLKLGRKSIVTKA